MILLDTFALVLQSKLITALNCTSISDKCRYNCLNWQHAMQIANLIQYQQSPAANRIKETAREFFFSFSRNFLRTSAWASLGKPITASSHICLRRLPTQQPTVTCNAKDGHDFTNNWQSQAVNTHHNQIAFRKSPSACSILWAKFWTVSPLENSNALAPRSQSRPSTVVVFSGVLKQTEQPCATLDVLSCIVLGAEVPLLVVRLRSVGPNYFFRCHLQLQTTAHWSTAQSRPPREMRRLSSGKKSTAVTWLLWPPYMWLRHLGWEAG